MQRNAFNFLNEWFLSPGRKPLILRGARQVGKTWLVRELARNHSKTLIELNFEKDPSLKSVFESNQPTQIIKLLAAVLQTSIDVNNSILFLDEIQAVPELIAKLRWFAEEMPELPVISAGSLLEFALRDHTFSMPVGRISFAHIEPLSFEEFLQAYGKQASVDYLNGWEIGEKIPEVLHYQLLGLFKEYTLVGGMPAAVANWVSQQSTNSLSQIHRDLLASYRNDFSKYSGKMDTQRLEETMVAVPRFLVQKFVFSNVNPDVHSGAIKQALTLLNLARVCHRVQCSASNGVPLGSETRAKFFKEIFLDVGLACALLELSLSDLNRIDDLTLINSGAVAEQVVGQLLRTLNPFYVEPALFYWQREEEGSQAEVDYVIQHGPVVIPIEVKAGATGKLKSLHLLMTLKKLSIGVRIYSGMPLQSNDACRLISLPFYLMGQLRRVLGMVTL